VKQDAGLMIRLTKTPLRAIFVFLVVAPLFANSALCLEVERKIEAPGIPAEIWKIAGEFCSIETWHPLVRDCEQTKDGEAIVRILTALNGAVVKERLLHSDQTSYSYVTLESPLPVDKLSAKLWLEGGNPNQTIIHWDAKFDAKGATDEEAKRKISKILTSGLKKLRSIATEKMEAGGD
jgi:hypothetical protein